MTDYELLYIVSGEKTESDVTAVTDAVNNSLAKAGGKIGSENLWGRRRLAYPIAKQEHGWYVVTKFSLDGPKLNDWEKVLQIQDGVVRTVIVRSDEIPSEEEAARIDESLSGAERTARQKEARPSRRPASDVPEELVKTAAKKPAPTNADAAAAKTKAVGSGPSAEAEPKPESASEQRKRQAKLDEKLDQILTED